MSGASKKLGQAKFTDSIQKLVDFNSTVYDLSQPNRKGETKMDPDDATSLTDGANDAINATVSVDVINDNKPEYSNRCSNKVVFSSGELDALCD